MYLGRGSSSNKQRVGAEARRDDFHLLFARRLHAVALPPSRHFLLFFPSLSDLLLLLALLCPTVLCFCLLLLGAMRLRVGAAAAETFRQLSRMPTGARAGAGNITRYL